MIWKEAEYLEQLEEIEWECEKTIPLFDGCCSTSEYGPAFTRRQRGAATTTAQAQLGAADDEVAVVVMDARWIGK